MNSTTDYWRKRCLAAEAVLYSIANKSNSTAYAKEHLKKWHKWNNLNIKKPHERNTVK